MTKALVLLALVLSVAGAIGLVSGSSRSQRATSGAPPSRSARKALIVVLSRTGNTRAVAETIRREVGGMIVALELQTPYPADYKQTVAQVARENETGFLPPLKTKIDDIREYDTVFVGFPTWGMQLPPPVKSFLRSTDLQTKTVVPFNTNAGYGEGSSFRTVKELCPKSTVLKGFVTTGGIERDGKLLVIKGGRATEVQKAVRDWLGEIGMLR